MTDDHVTELLTAASRGEPEALERLMPLVHSELLDIARKLFARERPGHTLQPTALVNEAYLRLVDQSRAEWRDRAHFKAVAATVMRRVLTDHARHKGRRKRGGDMQRVTLDDEIGVSETRSPLDHLALDQALSRLAERDELTSRVIELRFYAGLEIAEIAEVLKVSSRTVGNRWAWGRSWLYKALN